MAKCSGCGTAILFGGVKRGNLRFCNETCAAQSQVAQAASRIPDEIIDAHVAQLHQGDCPKCGGPGPVDLRTSHRVYSAVVFTSWSSHPLLCCAACGRSEKIKNGLFSLALGWWGFPFGFVITPVQIIRNLIGITGLGEPDPEVPSPALHDVVLRSLASRIPSEAIEVES